MQKKMSLLISFLRHFITTVVFIVCLFLFYIFSRLIKFNLKKKNAHGSFFQRRKFLSSQVIRDYNLNFRFDRVLSAALLLVIHLFVIFGRCAFLPGSLAYSNFFFVRDKQDNGLLLDK